MRITGTRAYGIRLPIIKTGDDLAGIVADALGQAIESQEVELRDHDIVAITESILARCQGNYISVKSVTKDLNEKFDKSIGVLFPVLSRNRFSLILQAVIATKKPITIVLNYPSDEVGNELMKIDTLIENDINPYTQVLTEEEYRAITGAQYPHPFTGIDYVSLYKEMAIDNNVTIVFANDPTAVLKFTDEVLVANIHDRNRLKRKLLQNGAKTVYSLDEICTTDKGEGYNPDFGLLGSNLSSNDMLKLFPRDSEAFVFSVQRRLHEVFGLQMEVMIYGDGAFKDPVGKIWELADPVVSPGYTLGLEGMPNELKLKYIADNELSHLNGNELSEAMREKIRHKGANLLGSNESLGTTPRHITDLLGSLADLVSGSGDKGTPVVLIQGYFDNYGSE